ncbi:TonB-dependent receptor [Prolixibacteraceae bacterium Z1-6]|uniref:TonB-dependent receptor n=1 Tax=Draconibacterium aestuarii TaxID=2998507 RepID=A0A9X3F5A7_9BACT|nr:TonB-dependent receptor [Prolixibacteraceae bacterium Z1-6]
MKNRFVQIILVFSFCSIFTNGLYAQMHFSTEDTIEINEVIVTGTQVKVNRNNVPMSVSVINKNQIEESDESALLPVLNGRVPGLFVTERGVTGFGVAAGSAGQISIRGIGGNPTTGVLMLIDGHPQFMGIMGHPLPDSYVASDVEKVEVIRGPASVLYGSNAMGGVINIITKKQVEEGIHGNTRISYGSFNTQKYMGSAGFKRNKFSAFISGNHDQTDGHRPNSDFKISNGYLKLGYDFNEHFSVSTDFSLATFKSSDPGPDTINASPGESIDILRGYWAFTLLNEFEKASGGLKVFYNFGEHEITDGFHSTDHNYGMNIYEAFHLFKGNTITTGYDFMNYGGLAENKKIMGGQGIVFADTTLTEQGIYALIQHTVTEKLTFNAGLRYHHHSKYGGQWVPSLGFAYELQKQTIWKGSVSKGFRSPTMRELFLWGPNPNLNPESIWNYETGLSKSFFNQKIYTELTLFMLKGDNLIVNTGPPNGLQNTSEVSNKGIEFTLSAEAAKNLNLNATYSYINMENPVYATPEHHLFLNARYRLKKLQLSASFQQISNLDNDASVIVNLESYTLVNAKATYNLTRNLKIFISGKNLLNTKYEVNRYYDMPGTTVFSGLNLIF